jgi:MSHA biogenesis protein MshE
MLELNNAMADALRMNDINGFTRAVNDVPNFVTLSEAALGYAIEGKTTLEEVMSISAQIDEI